MEGDAASPAALPIEAAVEYVRREARTAGQLTASVVRPSRAAARSARAWDALHPVPTQGPAPQAASATAVPASARSAEGTLEALPPLETQAASRRVQPPACARAAISYSAAHSAPSACQASRRSSCARPAAAGSVGSANPTTEGCSAARPAPLSGSSGHVAAASSGLASPASASSAAEAHRAQAQAQAQGTGLNRMTCQHAPQNLLPLQGLTGDDSLLSLLFLQGTQQHSAEPCCSPRNILRTLVHVLS